MSEPLSVIGRGTCGTVYEIPGIDRALKIGSPTQNDIWWDFLATNTAHKYSAISEPLFKFSRDFQEDVFIPRVPRGFEYHTGEDTIFWNGMASKLPVTEKMPRAGFVMERIPPVPEEIRRDLITQFFPPSERTAALATVNKENSACLIRLYFGKNAQPNTLYESLWNFELHLNQMTQLGLDTRHLVKELSVGLSVVHWQAFLDGRDVEFVLGASTERPALPPTIEDPEDISKPFDISDHNLKQKQRSMRMWMLDFDKTRNFSLKEENEEILDQLVPAVHGNDPYFPNPTLDEDLWELFANTYIKASAMILERKVYNLPRKPRMRILDLPNDFIDLLRSKFIEQAEFEERIEDYIQFDSGSDEQEDEDEDEEEDYAEDEDEGEYDELESESEEDQNNDGETEVK